MQGFLQSVSDFDLKNVLYLDRPVNVQSHTNGELFRYDQINQQLQRIPLQFGDEAGRFLALSSGANEGDSFVLSDMSTFGDAQTIAVKQ